MQVRGFSGPQAGPSVILSSEGSYRALAGFRQRLCLECPFLKSSALLLTRPFFFLWELCWAPPPPRKSTLSKMSFALSPGPPVKPTLLWALGGYVPSPQPQAPLPPVLAVGWHRFLRACCPLHAAVCWALLPVSPVGCANGWQ